ncbi:flagellar motor protein MotB, partial [Streptomyces malaysiensis]|uniref:flagellar motor protein MotB n=1 Tax=Streptomyces malaysiensis TaxID=92644 RepID=UPI0031FCC587
MKRRSLTRRPHSAGLDRWLVSYADYMTLVFALFVVLYALHASKSEGQRQLAEGMQQALVRLSGQQPPDAVAVPTAVAAADEALALADAEPLDSSLAELEQQLYRQLAPLIEQQLVEFERDGDWLTLNLDGDLLFASGSALLGPNSRP